MLKQVSVRLDDALIKRVKITCVEEGISFQEAVRKALEAWLETEDNQE